MATAAFEAKSRLRLREGLGDIEVAERDTTVLNYLDKAHQSRASANGNDSKGVAMLTAKSGRVSVNPDIVAVVEKLD